MKNNNIKNLFYIINSNGKHPSFRTYKLTK